jgi:hypothetical protein
LRRVAEARGSTAEEGRDYQASLKGMSVLSLRFSHDDYDDDDDDDDNDECHRKLIMSLV